jgi:hypothetical protein
MLEFSPQHTCFEYYFLACQASLSISKYWFIYFYVGFDWWKSSSQTLL